MVQQPGSMKVLTLCEVEAYESISIIDIMPDILAPGTTIDLTNFNDSSVQSCSLIESSLWTTDAVIHIHLATPFKFANASVIVEGINFGLDRYVFLKKHYQIKIRLSLKYLLSVKFIIPSDVMNYQVT